VRSGQSRLGASTAKVFISYSRRDLDFADRIDAALKARGFDTLIDRSEIYALEDWWKRIEALIAQADTIVFILSPDAVASEVCQSEARFAVSLNKRLAPVVHRRVEDSRVPLELARLNFIFFDDETQFDTSLNRLAEARLGAQALRVRRARPALADRRPPRSARPAAAHQRSTKPSAGSLHALPTPHFQLRQRKPSSPPHRRRNIVSASLAAGLFVASASPVSAYWQRGIAVEQRDRARS
jgi:hypothetical protein